MKRILSLLLLIPGALNAMYSTELDLGSEKSCKQLQVVASLTQEPYGSQVSSSDRGVLSRLYTNSNARLHCVSEKDEDTVIAGNHAVHVNLYDGMLQENSTKVVVDYELTQLPMLSFFFSPTTIKYGHANLTIGGAEHKVEHSTSSNESVTLTLIAKWQAYRVTKHGYHVKVESASANASTNYDDQAVPQ